MPIIDQGETGSARIPLAGGIARRHRRQDQSAELRHRHSQVRPAHGQRLGRVAKAQHCQRERGENSNEISAIPELLRLVELCWAIVNIDIMGCQTVIAPQIVEGGADYILAVKGNQPTPHEGIVEHFLDQMDDFARTSLSRCETTESGHGRQEYRTYYVLDVPGGCPTRVVEKA